MATLLKIETDDDRAEKAEKYVQVFCATFPALGDSNIEEWTKAWNEFNALCKESRAYDVTSIPIGTDGGFMLIGKAYKEVNK